MLTRDLAHQVCDWLLQGRKQTEIAKELNKSRATVMRYVRWMKNNGMFFRRKANLYKRIRLAFGDAGKEKRDEIAKSLSMTEATLVKHVNAMKKIGEFKNGSYFSLKEKERRGFVRKREWNLKHKYGLNADIVEEMLIKQDHKCAICKQEETTKRNGKVRLLSVDHDHKTGEIRGLLCARCNVLLGVFEKLSGDEDLVTAMEIYLKCN